VVLMFHCYSFTAQFWPMVAKHHSKIRMSFVDSLRLKEAPENDTPTSKKLSEGSGSRQSSTNEPMEES